MVSLKKALKEFINSIPGDKLTGFPSQAKTLYTDENFRLDMQGVTTEGAHNLQIQANKQAKVTSVRKAAPQTVAGPVLVASGSTASSEDVRNAFLSGSFPASL